MADKNKEFDWYEKCKDCRFCWSRERELAQRSGGRCKHPSNKIYSCVGFRRDVPWSKRVLFKDVRCGRDAIFFEPRTLETDEAERLKKLALKEKLVEVFEKEIKSVFADRLNMKNVLDRHIDEALNGAGYHICLCGGITFDYKDEEGRNAIAREILRSFDIKMKEEVRIKEEKIAIEIAEHKARYEVRY